MLFINFIQKFWKTHRKPLSKHYDTQRFTQENTNDLICKVDIFFI